MSLVEPMSLEWGQKSRRVAGECMAMTCAGLAAGLKEFLDSSRTQAHW
jgi:hypothetical protein